MKKLISSLALISFGLSGVAGVLTPEQALKRVQSVKAVKSAIPSIKQSPRLVATRSAGEQPAVYLFSTVDGSQYFVLSADDCAAPVLGYGDADNFDAADINPAMQWWLDEYAAQIEWLRENGNGSEYSATMQQTDHPAIAPLMSTTWDQDEPYNYLCPMDSYGYMHYPTGCGATAMAQVLKYHRYASITFDWSNMLDSYSGSYTDQQRNAVAKLMAECGSASRTVYNSYGSSATALEMAKGLISLGYDKYIARPYMTDYSIKGWDDFMYSQLCDYGPVIVNGFRGQTGHAFVCDGYAGNGYFHINWGWGGRSNGYFKLTAMIPEEQGTGGSSGGYNSNVNVIANISPSTLGLKPNYILMAGSFGVKISEIALGEEFTINSLIQNRNQGSFSGTIGYKLVSEVNGGEQYFVIKEQAFIWGEKSISNLSASIPVDVTEGNYRMYLMYKGQDEDDWRRVNVSSYEPAYVNVRVENGMAYFSDGIGVDLSVEIDEFDTPFFIDCEFRFNATITNNGEGDYRNDVYAVLYGEDETTKYAYGSDTPIFVLQSGDSEGFEYISKFKTYRNMTITPGKYKLAFVDYYNTIVSEMYPIEIQDKPDTSQSQIEIISEGTEFMGNPDNVNNNDIDFLVKVKATRGYFIGQIWAKFFEEGSTYSSQSLYSNTLYIPQDETQTIHIAGALPDLEIGKNYDVVLYAKSGKLTDTIATLHISASTTSIDAGSKAAKEVVSKQLFTLTGVYVDATNASKGVYIERIVYSDDTVESCKRMIK